MISLIKKNSHLFLLIISLISVAANADTNNRSLL